MTTDARVLDWLLDSDPALRWQVERDLAGEPPEVWQATRRRVASEGFGARLRQLQDDDGQWAGGAFFPAGFFESEEAKAPGQPWTATTWVLKDLREWGLDAAALEGTAEKLAANSRWEYDDLPYWGGEVDVCINSYTLASGAWLGADVSALAAWFPAHRLADGGWNCEAEEGDSVRSSFHSTLNAVRGILAYERITGDDGLRDARRGGEEYLLSRQLMFRASTGEVVGDFVTRFVFPNRHRYSALAALDHFRDVALLEGSLPDPRLAAAIEVVREARQPDGTWLQTTPLAGRTWFDVDVPEGQPSRWLTLIGTRVLDWWDAAT
ncbi:squalene cyclase [Microbacterium sp. M3]|uniref:Squalene cyclase n=1 Tax=Microbacterium arthrosphaerae TaxID=792652 RepID=A0ABU4H4N1_9MICO|nr:MULTISPECIES: squalene cyclase [Microbacterium]MDW4573697.1 squalene cyclase [Microbacterium arthrosphaerae]MDW7607552.1 squalene cyclase [Microbacterium sp. M3]